MSRATPTTRAIPRRNLEALAWGLAALFAILALVKLSAGFERLLLVDGDGAVDLKLRFDETRAWFAGYWLRGAVYPPASQAILWPVVGWLPFDAVRGFWAALSLASLGWLSWICARECGLRSTAGRIACALLPLAATATGSAVGIGQIVPIFLPVVVTSVLWMARGRSGWLDATCSAVLFTIASVKPTLFAPFAWLVLLLPRSRRPALLSGALYVALTLVALSALRDGPARGGGGTIGGVVANGIEQRMTWATTVRRIDDDKTTLFGGGYGNLQNMSYSAGMVGLQNFVLPIASVLACGLWLLRHRRTDPWIMLAVCALAARLGWYHRVYDDMLLVLPAIAFVRILASHGTPDGADGPTARTAAILLAATLAPLLSPGTLADLLLHVPRLLGPWIWLADLLFLGRVAPAFDRAEPRVTAPS